MRSFVQCMPVVLQRPQAQDTGHAEYSGQRVMPDIKHQNIIYYMSDVGKSVDAKDHVQIDLAKALSEMREIDWSNDDNYIGFENNDTNECLQFHRGGRDQWFADVPIRNPTWEGYFWRSVAGTASTFGMVGLFFEENPMWFGTLCWKMNRTKKPGSRVISDEDFS